MATGAIHAFAFPGTGFDVVRAPPSRQAGGRMRALIRHAGLRPEQEQRLRLAAGALSAHGISAGVEAWDGTRCDLVAVGGEDGYGRHVQTIATRRSVGVLVLGGKIDGAGRAPDDASAAALVRHLLAILQPGAGVNGHAAAPTAAVATAQSAGLVNLAQDPRLADKDLEAQVAGRSIQLLRSSGRVLSATLSDQMTARDRLCEGGWSFRALPPGQAGDQLREFAGSLDAFLLQGALRSAALLPPFPAQSCSLQDWPDLGASPDAIAALRLVRTLSAQPVSPADLARTHAVDPRYVGACLWAFAASGLLRRHGEPAAAPPAAKPASGILARLAAHFGLTRAG